jgi:hypothetical protein
MIDLHLHSIFSDGSLTPEELVALGAQEGARCLALTDHDTTRGTDRMLAAGKAAGIEIIPGVEISADYSPGTMHILGYFIDHKDAELNRHLEWIQSGREARNQEILHNLMELGVHITWDQVAARAGDDIVGRPHFAQVMVEQGYVENNKEAFTRYLAKGKPAYAGRRRLKPEACIELIQKCGGLPVLAHPCTLKLQNRELRMLLGHLTDAGLQGIEIYYSEHSRDMLKNYLKLAKDFGLVATGGTDFHGEMTPDIKIGRGFGTLNIPDSIVEQLKARLGIPLS